MRKSCLGFIYFMLLCSAALAKDRTIVHNGIIDLRNWNWQKDGIINLTGDWEFYQNRFYPPLFFKDTSGIQAKQFIFVPSLISGFGYATYHLTVLCPQSHEQLALKFLTVESAYK